MVTAALSSITPSLGRSDAGALLHVYRLALIREPRIAGRDEEPPNAAQRGDDLLDQEVTTAENLGFLP